MGDFLRYLRIDRIPFGVAFFFAAASTALFAQSQPLQVFVLAGQSNMQGHAEARTLESLGTDPKTAPILSKLSGNNGQPKECEHVWITSIGHDGSNAEKHGRLSIGFGAASAKPKIGPEYAFGIYAAEMVDGPVLIIKTAWGGKSLNTDFRPPSAGPYEFSEAQFEVLRKRGKQVADEEAAKMEAVGRYYRLMIDHIGKTLIDIERVCPDYDSNAGYELAGFVWFQGWNDMVDSGTYPNRRQPGGYDEYSSLLAAFIRDVRKDLAAPDLPFVIGVMGVGGPVENYGPNRQRVKAIHSEFRSAMAAPALSPEFRGLVKAVMTEKYWDRRLGDLAMRWDAIRRKRRELNKDKSLSVVDRKLAIEKLTADLFTPEELETYESGVSNAAYHYLGSGKIICQIGKAFAEAFEEF